MFALKLLLVVCQRLWKHSVRGETCNDHRLCNTESNPSTNPNYATQTLQQHNPNYFTFTCQYICVQDRVSARESGAADNEFKVLQDQKTVTARVWRTVHRFPFKSSQWENVAVQSVLWSPSVPRRSFLWPFSHWVAPACQKIWQKQRLKTSCGSTMHYKGADLVIGRKRRKGKMRGERQTMSRDQHWRSKESSKSPTVSADRSFRPSDVKTKQPKNPVQRVYNSFCFAAEEFACELSLTD